MIFSAVVAPTSGYLRAQGRTGSLMVASLSVEVGLRQLYLFLMANFISNDYLHIICVIPFGHIALGLILLLMCLYDSRRTLRGV
jgi:Na+-driven multidrug efflux pump